MAGEPTDDFEESQPGGSRPPRDAAKAERYQEMRDRGRQIGGVPGAMVAGLMIALRDIYDAPPNATTASRWSRHLAIPTMSTATAWPCRPTDIGGSDDVTIAALERRPPIVARRRAPQRRALPIRR